MSRVSTRIVAVMTAALLALVMAVPAFAQTGEAQVRVAHLASDAPNVDVYVNGEPVEALLNVPYGTVSSYLMLPAGTQQVTVYPAGDTSTPVIDTPVELAGGAAYTIGAVGLVGDGSLTAQVYEDDLSAPAEGNGKVRAVHASPDAGPVDVVPAGGDPLVTGLEFPNASPYAEVPAGSYTLNINAAGTDQTAISADATIDSGTTYSAFAVGTAAAGNLDVILTVDSVGGMSQMPDTGGISPVVISSVALLALAVGVTGLYALRRRTA